MKFRFFYFKNVLQLKLRNIFYITTIHMHIHRYLTEKKKFIKIPTFIYTMHSDILNTITCLDFFNAVLLYGIHIQHTVSKTVAWGLLRLSSGSHTTNIQEYTARSQTDNLVLNSGDRS